MTKQVRERDLWEFLYADDVVLKVKYNMKLLVSLIDGKDNFERRRLRVNIKKKKEMISENETIVKENGKYPICTVNQMPGMV